MLSISIILWQVNEVIFIVVACALFNNMFCAVLKTYITEIYSLVLEVVFFIHGKLLTHFLVFSTQRYQSITSIRMLTFLTLSLPCYGIITFGI